MRVLLVAALLWALAPFVVLAQEPVWSPMAPGELATMADDTFWLQSELDRIAAEGGGVLQLEGRPYLISAPLIIRPRDNSGHAMLILRGQGIYKTAIIKTTNTTAALPKRQARRGAVADIMAVDAVLVLDHPDNDFTRMVTIEDLSLHGASGGAGVKYGLYAPRLARATIRDVAIEFCSVGMFGYQWFLVNIERAYLSGLTRSDGAGLWISDDGTGSGGSTTVNLRGCFAQMYSSGYRAFGLHYSAWDGCAVDNVGAIQRPGAAYWLEYCRGLTLTSCGTERAIGRTIKAVGGSLDARGFYATGTRGGGANTGTVELHNALATFSGCMWMALAEPGGQNDVRYSGTTRVTWISTQAPNGGAGIAGTATIATLP